MNQSKLSDCRRTLDNLPWYANRTLDAAALAEVENHLQSCGACRHELKFLKSVIDNMPAPRPLHDGAPAFGRLLHRVNRNEHTTGYWKVAAGLLVALALVLAVTIPGYLLEPRFHTVMDSVPATERVQFEVIIRRPEELAGILQQHEADLVTKRAGDTYILEVRATRDPADLQNALQADPRIETARLLTASE